MALEMKVSVCTFICFLLSALTSTSSTATDIHCLKSIKDSLEDPLGYLSSWNFNNYTEGFICRFTGVDCWHPDESRVINLELSNMGLKGQFPTGIKNCSSVTGFNVSNNELQGQIPFDIANILGFVTSLDLSSNNFSGEIPSGIANCSYLNFLKLDHNRLTGHIPQQIANLTRLKTISVANNLLSGPVPNFEGGRIFPAESYENNVDLCGRPLERCRDGRSEFLSAFKNGFLIGCSFFAVSVIVVYMYYFVPWLETVKTKRNITIAEIITSMRKKKIRKKKKRQTQFDRVVSLTAAEILKLNEIYNLEKMITRLDYEDLSKATNNFGEQNIIGFGKLGIMYKAILHNGHFLAVKKLQDSCSLGEQFLSEFKTLGKLKHINLLPLLGFCIKSNENLLVYKYMPNGNLYDRLHAIKGEAKVMEWPVRVRIAIGLIRGLTWLHHGSNTKIIHLNIISKCVLLDENFEPKLSNFTEAMLINLDDNVSSVNGEFWQMPFIKEDVLSFGVVLLELIMSNDTRKMNDESASYNGFQDVWIGHLLSSSIDFYDRIDKSLIGKGFEEEIIEFLKIGFSCIQRIPDERPTMLQVYKDTRHIAEKYGLTDENEQLLQPEASVSSPEGRVDEIEIAKS